MNKKTKVAVCSRSFSNNPLLRTELLNKYAQVTFNDTGKVLHNEELITFLSGHDKAIVALEKVDAYVLSKLPELNVISKYGVGLDSLDILAMRKYGKRLGWTGGVNRRSVSELVIAFAISMLRHIPVANAGVREGRWNPVIGNLLSGQTIGIIGCGHIGQDLVGLLKPFGCKIFVNDIRDNSKFNSDNGVIEKELNELLATADIITLHVPLNSSTYGILNADRLKIMKKGSILINTARGGLVDEAILKSMLMNGSLAAAAFDVFAIEPPSDLELLLLPNFLVTPHIGGSAFEAIIAMGRAAIDGLDINSIPEGINL
jgi:phosphoglycerate dehydrogenase-like enzyme